MMSKTNLQIAKPAHVSQNTGKANAGISYSPQIAEFPVNRIQPSKQTIIQPKLDISRPDDEYEKEAGSIADKVMRMADPSFKDEKNIQAKPIAETISPLVQTSMNGASEQSLSNSDLETRINNSKNGGSPLPENSRAFMESSFGADFSHVKIHTDANAVQMNKELNAQAFTHGSDIYFNSGRFNAESSSGKHLLAHELTHTIQQKHQFVSKKIMREILPDELPAFPAIDKRRIKISWKPVTAAILGDMDELFGTTPKTAGGIAVSKNKGSGTVVFNNIIPASPSSKNGYDVRHGLNNIAFQLESGSNMLPLNSTITITLDLTKYGGLKGNFRFTYFEHVTGTGKSATLEEITLIEQLGAAVAAPTVKNPDDAAPAADFAYGGQTFKLGSGWTLQKQALLNQALALVPANGITQLAGATFVVDSVTSTEEGNYDEDTHTITIRLSAFNLRLNAYEGGSDSTRIILHEIAHAIDRRMLRDAWKEYNSSEFKAADEKKLKAATSLSGTSYVFDKEEKIFVQKEGKASTDFRKAVIADRKQSGVVLPKGITEYSATNWEENFAEAFAFYMVDKKLFKELRPNTYDYFLINYP